MHGKIGKIAVVIPIWVRIQDFLKEFYHYMYTLLAVVKSHRTQAGGPQTEGNKGWIDGDLCFHIASILAILVIRL